MSVICTRLFGNTRTIARLAVCLICALGIYCLSADAQEDAADAVTKFGRDKNAAPAYTLSLGTGEEGGRYLPMGKNLAELVSKHSNETAITIVPVPTSGSVENINGLREGKFQLALAQSDKQFQAVEGRAEWSRNPQTNLRFLCSLGTEAVTLVATVESGIQTPADLKGKRVGIGAAGSGYRYNAVQVLSAFGIDSQTGITANEQPAAACAKALQAGELDAFFYTAGHPNDIIRAATTGTRKTRLVPIAGDGIALLLEANPHLTEATIPAKNLYPDCANSDVPVPTFGVMTSLLCNADLSDRAVEQLVQEIYGNLESLSGLQKADTLAISGRTAPFHPGALTYFKKLGLPVE